MKRRDGWSALFSKAFEQSRNAMVLLDEQRQIVDVNGAAMQLLGHRRAALIGEPVARFVPAGPLLSRAGWQAALGAGQFSGVTDLLCADGSRVTVQWGARAEVVSARQLVLFVALSTSRWGRHFRRPSGSEGGTMTAREREIVRLVALGSTGPEIADELQIAHDTVRTHVRNAMTKLGARSRAHLVAKAIGDGLVLD
jgi:PAS domain S-box-containing protein